MFWGCTWDVGKKLKETINWHASCGRFNLGCASHHLSPSSKTYKLDLFLSKIFISLGILHFQTIFSDIFTIHIVDMEVQSLVPCACFVYRWNINMCSQLSVLCRLNAYGLFEVRVSGDGNCQVHQLVPIQFLWYSNNNNKDLYCPKQFLRPILFIRWN